MNAFIVRRLSGEADWHAVREIRRQVFIEEQHCPPEEEWDEHDEPAARGATCIHLLGLLEGAPAATSRWREVAADEGPAAKLERFAVLAQYRGRGLGHRMVEAAMDDARCAGHGRFILHAQSYLTDFYSAFGFVPAGRPFEEAGIEHVKMVLASR